MFTAQKLCRRRELQNGVIEMLALIVAAQHESERIRQHLLSARSDFRASDSRYWLNDSHHDLDSPIPPMVEGLRVACVETSTGESITSHVKRLFCGKRLIGHRPNMKVNESDTTYYQPVTALAQAIRVIGETTVIMTWIRLFLQWSKDCESCASKLQLVSESRVTKNGFSTGSL